MSLDFGKIYNKLVNMFKMIDKDDKNKLSFDEVMRCIQDGHNDYSWFKHQIPDNLKGMEVHKDEYISMIKQIYKDFRMIIYKELDDGGAVEEKF